MSGVLDLSRGQDEAFAVEGFCGDRLQLCPCAIREMRIQFGMILLILLKQRINENTVWTDSQDYGADEILYTTGIALFDKINRFKREIIILFEIYPQLSMFLHG
jgi:hypothetical protein